MSVGDSRNWAHSRCSHFQFNMVSFLEPDIRVLESIRCVIVEYNAKL